MSLILLGIRNNKIIRQPLMYCVAKTREINEAIQTLDFERAMELRGHGYQEAFRILRTMVRAMPHSPKEGKPTTSHCHSQRRWCRAGDECCGAYGSTFECGQGPYSAGHSARFSWFDQQPSSGIGLVFGQWLGSIWVVRYWAQAVRFPTIPNSMRWRAHWKSIRSMPLLIIGGFSGYQAAAILQRERRNFPSFKIPIFCIPATIDNNLPAAEFSIGADTALNSITDAVDKIKQSAVASNRVFVVEVMGNYCGYLGLMSALSTGAERVYMHEEGIRLADLQEDIENLRESFVSG